MTDNSKIPIKKRKKYVTTKYRLRPDALKLIKFLEWKELNEKGLSYDKYICNTAVKESLILLKEGKVKIDRAKYKRRKDLSLTFDKDTISELESYLKEVKLFKGELIEICLFIYAMRHLTENERELNNLFEWNVGIKILS